jgi:Tfp pilus assembly protein PilO
MSKFTLEKIDDENVKKIDTHESVSVVNIPALQKQKEEMEKQIATTQQQLVQINEVLDEYKKLPQT